MKIVLDTNVLISGLLSQDGIPAQVLNLVLNRRVTLLVDTRIISEYIDVLKHPKFRFKAEWIDPVIDFIRMESEIIIPEPSNRDFPDPDDRMFWEAAVTGNAFAIVSGNTRHFPEDPLVMTPAQFLESYLKYLPRTL
jgi:uncharacterized protein